MTLKQVGPMFNSHTRPHPLHPTGVKGINSSNADEMTLKKLASLASVRLHDVVMAKDDTPTMTSRQYGRRAIFVSGDVRFQDGDIGDLSKLGDRFVPFFLLSFDVCTYASTRLITTTFTKAC